VFLVLKHAVHIICLYGSLFTGYLQKSSTYSVVIFLHSSSKIYMEFLLTKAQY